MVATWSGRPAAGDDRIDEARPALAAAVYGRVRMALADWLGKPGLSVEVELIGPDEAHELSRTARGFRASLPFRWLHDVWAPGYAIVFGHFTLELNQVSEERRLLVVSPDFGLRHVTVTIEDDGPGPPPSEPHLGELGRGRARIDRYGRRCSPNHCVAAPEARSNWSVYAEKCPPG